MSKTVSFDTNVILRWILQDVPKQNEDVLRLLKNPDVTTIHIADVVFAEVVWVLESLPADLTRRQIAEMLEIVLDFPKALCNQTLLRPVLAEYVQHPALSFVDICLAHYAELNDAVPLYTFDKKLALQATSAELLPLA